MNERAWNRAYGEDERDLTIKHCEVQLDVIKGAMLPSSELKFRLHSLFFDIHSKVTIALSTSSSQLYSIC
jgi:hypothetical protein